MARLEAGSECFAFCSLCQQLFSLFIRLNRTPPSPWCARAPCRNGQRFPVRGIASVHSGRYPLSLRRRILRITERVQMLLCSLTLWSACFLPSLLGGQAKPTATHPPPQPAQKSLPAGPPVPHSTHYPILLLGFGNQPNWNARIGLKGPERFDREGYPPIPLEPGEVTQDATPESWTYHAKDSSTGAPVAIHLSRETCQDAANDTLTACSLS